METRMTIKFSDITGGGIPYGNNAGRPANPGIGKLYSNGEAQRLELYTSAGWTNIVQETPGVSSISGTYSEQTDSGVIVIAGTNFATGCYATAIGSNGIQVDATSTTFNSIVQVTATFNGLSNAYEPYDIKVTNPSNLFGIIPDALYINASPVWQTASGSLGSFNEQVSVSVSATATDSDSTITYALASGSSLPSGVSLNSSTGAITGTLPGITTNTTYNFTINASDGVNTIPRSFSITSLADLTIEFLVYGAGGGSGTSNRTSTSYRTANYYRVKEGGAGGVVYGSYDVKSGTQLRLSVGGGGQGGMLAGNPSSAAGGYNGGGNGSYSQNDCSGGGGGYSGVFLNSIGKSQAGAILMAPGGGGGGGGPGYPRSNEDQANGGGGITSTGLGNNGTRQNSPTAFIAVAGGGGLTSGGAGGDASISNGDGAAGSALTGANSVYYNNPWGTGGAGGGGWYGGGSGANDGSDWSGGGGASGSAFVRGSGITYNADGNTSLNGITYKTHTFYPQTYGTYGDGTNPSFGPVSGEMNPGGVLNSMRMPVQTTNAQYPGGNVAYGGAFRNSTSDPSGYTGGNGAIVYRINGGAWQTVAYTGSDTVITVS